MMIHESSKDCNRHGNLNESHIYIYIYIYIFRIHIYIYIYRICVLRCLKSANREDCPSASGLAMTPLLKEIQRLSQRLAESEMYSAKNSVVISVFEKCC